MPGSRPAGSPGRTECWSRSAGPGLSGSRRDGGRLAFAAPPLTRSGPVAEEDLARIAAGLGMPREALLDASWLVNGPDWIGVLLESAEAVLGIRPDYAAMAGLKVGVIGPHPAGSEVGFEVRTFIPGDAAAEDPVTGSFNAGAAQWLIRSGRAPESYVAAQGTVLGRAGTDPHRRGGGRHLGRRQLGELHRRLRPALTPRCPVSPVAIPAVIGTKSDSATTAGINGAVPRFYR